MEKTDAALIAAARNNPTAFSAVYRKYARKVFDYFFYRAGRDEDLAEDLAQETFLKAFRHLSRFEDRGHSYLSYLLAIAHNVLVSHFRKPGTLPIEAAFSVPDEREDVLRRSEAEALWRSVAELPLHERDALFLRYRDGLSIREIARVFRKSENAVKLILSRARKKLARRPRLSALERLPLKKTPTAPLRFGAKSAKRKPHPRQ